MAESTLKKKKGENVRNDLVAQRNAFRALARKHNHEIFELTYGAYRRRMGALFERDRAGELTKEEYTAQSKDIREELAAACKRLHPQLIPRRDIVRLQFTESQLKYAQ